MKSGLVAAALVAALALPAEATSPPNRQIARLRHQVATLQAKVVRLQKENHRLAVVDEQSSAFVQGVTGVFMTRVGLGDRCPLTMPNLLPPPGQMFGIPHGNGKLWVGVWHANIVRNPQAGGWINGKFGWYRGVPGKLTIEARRLDAPAPPARANVPDGYGNSGFQSSSVDFPTEGCWEVTGRVGTASITFVTVVLAKR